MERNETELKGRRGKRKGITGMWANERRENGGNVEPDALQEDHRAKTLCLHRGGDGCVSGLGTLQLQSANAGPENNRDKVRRGKEVNGDKGRWGNR